MSGRVFIADDESLARERLRRLLEDSPYSVCGEADNGESALTSIQTLQPDIVLLDIRMPGMDGLQAAEALGQSDYPPAVIFITAYDDYLLEAFRVNAQNYLLKPVRREALLSALEKASAISRAQLRAVEQTFLADAAENTGIVAQTRDGERRIPLAEVIYLQAENKYVTVHTLGESALTESSLKELENRHPELLRIHRNTLINPRHALGLTKTSDGSYQIKMKAGSTLLPVSRRLASLVRERLLGGN